MKPVRIVGAGFSGLTLAHELRRLNIPVEVVEARAQAGGMITTLKNEFGLVETAANALLANADVEQLFAELDLPFATPLKSRTRRFIYWRKPSRWPLGIVSTCKLIFFVIRLRLRRPSVQPREGESVRAWGRRVIDAAFEERMLTPALQGVYAGDSQKLSARMILTRLLNPRKVPRGRRRGSVAPEGGMGELGRRLRERLERDGVRFETGATFEVPSRPDQPVVVCASVTAAARAFAPHHPELARRLSSCEIIPLITVTAFFEPSPRDLRGFGCLFPAAQGFTALGVLFNSSIFANRSARRSETWIMGVLQHRDLLAQTDEEIHKLMLQDRERLTGEAGVPLSFTVTRWPEALPHYTLEWEQKLRALNPPEGIFLHGNYLGDLGLAQILARSKQLARHLKERYGH